MPAPDTPRLCRVAGRAQWHIAHQGRRRSTGCTARADAESVLAEYVASLSRSAAAPIGISAIIDAYLADRREAAIPGLPRLEWAAKPLRGFWGDRPAAAITEASSRAYARHRATAGVSPATTRTEMEALRAAMRWLHKTGRLATLPPMVLPARPPARDRWLTRDEAAMLIAAARGAHIRLFVVVGLYTAARAGAILGLTWDRVDLERRRIDLREPGKAPTRKGRALIPITNTLLEALTAAKARATTEWVIEWAGSRVASVKHGFAGAVAAAGLRGVTPHSLRHTAATWMAQDGVPLWQIAGWLGHSSPQMVADTYGHHHPDHMAEAAKALG